MARYSPIYSRQQTPCISIEWSEETHPRAGARVCRAAATRTTRPRTVADVVRAERDPPREHAGRREGDDVAGVGVGTTASGRPEARSPRRPSPFFRHPGAFGPH